MGIIGKIFGNLAGIERVAEVFVPNRTKEAEYSHLQKLGAQAQFGTEFQHKRTGQFDQFIDGLNRMPRPLLALGTVGLFVFAMVDPASFAYRMVGLNEVPQPLWWLLGAVVSFYFGSRELHYSRLRKIAPQKLIQPESPNAPDAPEMGPEEGAANPAYNDWKARAKG